MKNELRFIPEVRVEERINRIGWKNQKHFCAFCYTHIEKAETDKNLA
jgi:hypothetical protein